jgi:putative endopeptidase
MSSNRVFIALCLPLAVVASSLASQQPRAVSAVPVPQRLKVFDPAYIDRSVSACQDFFAFANGEWIKHDTIPAAFSTSGVSKEMTDANELVVRSVLEDAMAARTTKPANSTVAKLGRYYASCMDSTRAEREGVSPVKPELSQMPRTTWCGLRKAVSGCPTGITTPRRTLLRIRSVRNM